MKEKELFLKQFEMLESRIGGIEKTKFSRNFIDFVDLPRFVQWETQVETLLRQIYPPKLFPKALDGITSKTPNTMVSFHSVIGLFRAAHEDFKNGLLDDLQMRIESGLVVDYLQQAEALLEDAGDVDYSYVPAAVLVGATLEKTLRTLCGKQTPSIDVNNENGKPKKAQKLLDDLKKVDVFTPVEVKQVESWLAIRNAAAHGKNDEFSRADVASMIRGVTDFLAKHMR